MTGKTWLSWWVQRNIEKGTPMQRNPLVSFFLVGMATCLIGCSQTASSSLRNYFLHNIDSSVKISPIEDGMFDQSQRGYFAFDIASPDLPSLTQSLSLKEIKDQKAIEQLYSQDKDNLSSINLNITNPAWGAHTEQNSNQVSFLKPGIQVYRAEPDLKPMPGSQKASFLFLIYNSTSGRAYAIMEYLSGE